jgi:hypothetical protein
VYCVKRSNSVSVLCWSSKIFLPLLFSPPGSFLAPPLDSMLSAISVAQPVWFWSLQDSYKDNQDAQELLSTLAIQSPQGHYSLHQGVIRYKSAIWLGHSEELQNKVLHQFHVSSLGGHSRFLVTYQRVKNLFYWPKMKASIKDFVNAYVNKQKLKEFPILDYCNPLLSLIRPGRLSPWTS